ncbi:hypothetical protein MKX03_001403, partial [Papaver bracteatum]
KKKLKLSFWFKPLRIKPRLSSYATIFTMIASRNEKFEMIFMFSCKALILNCPVAMMMTRNK